MKYAVLFGILVVIALLIGFVRQGADFNPVKVLPFLSGDSPDLLFDGAAIVMLILIINGLRRLER